MSLEVPIIAETRPYRVPEPVIYNLLVSILNIPNENLEGLGLTCLENKENREFLERTKKSLDVFYASDFGPSEKGINELIEFLCYFGAHQGEVYERVSKESVKKILLLISASLSSKVKTELFIATIKNPSTPVARTQKPDKQPSLEYPRDRFVAPSTLQVCELQNLFALNEDSSNWKYPTYKDASIAAFDQFYKDIQDPKSRKRKRGNFVSNISNRQKNLTAAVERILKKNVPDNTELGKFFATLYESKELATLSNANILSVIRREFPIQEHIKELNKIDR